MSRMIRSIVTVAVLAISTVAQTRIELEEFLSRMPLTPSSRVVPTERAAVFATPEGHEIQVNWGQDSSISTFIAHPARSAASEESRRAFVRQVVSSSFGNDSTVAILFDQAKRLQGQKSGIWHKLDGSGWTLTLIMQDNKVTRLLARDRNVFPRQ